MDGIPTIRHALFYDVYGIPTTKACLSCYIVKKRMLEERSNIFFLGHLTCPCGPLYVPHPKTETDLKKSKCDSMNNPMA